MRAKVIKKMRLHLRKLKVSLLSFIGASHKFESRWDRFALDKDARGFGIR